MLEGLLPLLLDNQASKDDGRMMPKQDKDTDYRLQITDYRLQDAEPAKLVPGAKCQRYAAGPPGLA